MRSIYPQQQEAMPIKLIAVDDSPDTYILYNTWPKYEKYVTASESGYLHAWGEVDEALPIKFVNNPDRGGDEFFLINMQNNAQTYIGACANDCDNGFWFRSHYSSTKQAASVKLVPAADTRPWGYCTDPAAGVPSQINLQVSY